MSPLDVARRAFAAYLVGDAPGLVAVTDPDATWRFPGDPRVLPWAGEYRGAGITRFLDHVLDHLDYEEIRVEGAHVCCDRVFVTAFERFRVRATGRVCENRYAAVLTVRGDRVVGYEEYGDTAAMAAAFAW